MWYIFIAFPSAKSICLLRAFCSDSLTNTLSRRFLSSEHPWRRETEPYVTWNTSCMKALGNSSRPSISQNLRTGTSMDESHRHLYPMESTTEDVRGSPGTTIVSFIADASAIWNRVSLNDASIERSLFAMAFCHAILHHANLILHFKLLTSL